MVKKKINVTLIVIISVIAIGIFVTIGFLTNWFQGKKTNKDKLYNPVLEGKMSNQGLKKSVRNIVPSTYKPDQYYYSGSQAMWNSYSKKVENFSDGLEYSMKSSANTKAEAVEEGQNATITITRQGSGTSSTVYISTTASSADKDDYEKINLREITFGNEETTKTINISTKIDNIAEDGEYFFVDLYKSKADVEVGNYDTYITVYINDK